MTLTADDLHRWLLMEPVGNLASARGNAAPKFTPA
jgi:hypothetical protein